MAAEAAAEEEALKASASACQPAKGRRSLRRIISASSAVVKARGMVAAGAGGEEEEGEEEFVGGGGGAEDWCIVELGWRYAVRRGPKSSKFYGMGKSIYLVFVVTIAGRGQWAVYSGIEDAMLSRSIRRSIHGTVYCLVCH